MERLGGGSSRLMSKFFERAPPLSLSLPSVVIYNFRNNEESGAISFARSSVAFVFRL